MLLLYFTVVKICSCCVDLIACSYRAFNFRSFIVIDDMKINVHIHSTCVSIKLSYLFFFQCFSNPLKSFTLDI